MKMLRERFRRNFSIEPRVGDVVEFPFRSGKAWTIAVVLADEVVLEEAST